jgi:hypothetical protein
MNDEARIQAWIERADVVFIGETNDFVGKKADFRLWFLEHIARHRPIVLGEVTPVQAGHLCHIVASIGPASEADALVFSPHVSPRP